MMKTFRSIVICAVVLAGIYFVPRAYAQNPPQQQNEAKIVEVREITAMMIIDSTGSIVRRIPLPNVSRAEYNRFQREKRSRNPIKRSESRRAEVPDPHIEFRDENGRVTKSISIKREVITRTEPIDISNPERVWTVERIEGFTPVISDNGKFLLLVQYSFDASFTDPEGHIEYGEGANTQYQFSYYDVHGNVLFEKTLPAGDPIVQQFVSDNGEVVVIRIAAEFGSIDNPRTLVLDITGNEIMQMSSMNLRLLSPNGKYLADWNFRNTRFYNIFTKLFWDTPPRYFVDSLTDDGMASIRNLDTNQTIVIDLKELIKE